MNNNINIEIEKYIQQRKFNQLRQEIWDDNQKIAKKRQEYNRTRKELMKITEKEAYTIHFTGQTRTGKTTTAKKIINSYHKCKYCKKPILEKTIFKNAHMSCGFGI